jgi:hypothetical protein
MIETVQIDVAAIDFAERISVLARFRQLLEDQRKKLQDYLYLLEKQEKTILSDNTDAAINYCALEQDILENISTLQRVILPIEGMYREIYGTQMVHKDDFEIPKLQANLEKLRRQVQSQNESNRELLRSRLSQVRSQIDTFNLFRLSRSIYADDTESASLLEIEA